MKKRQIAAAVTVVGALVAVAGIATIASGQTLNYGQHTWTGVSGYSGAEMPILLRPEQATSPEGPQVFGRGMTGIILIRHRGKPVAGRVKYRLIGKRGQTGLRRHDQWHTHGWTDRQNVGSQTGGTVQTTVELVTPDAYVTGINVCTSNTGSTNGNTVQGIRLFLSRHTGGTNLERVGPAEAMQSDACARWHDRQNCPRGSIATGVKLHHNGSFVRGISLRCTALN